MIGADEIARRYRQVKERIAQACARARRPAESVRLVLAGKTNPPAALRAAYAAGAREFGENYVQEAVAKRAALADLKDVRWHLIGSLQSNKARAAAETFDVIQTLDRPRLAAAIARIRARPPMPMLIEVNIAGELSKSGVAPERLEALIEASRGLVDLLGLMAIPPAAEASEAGRRWFAALRGLRDRMRARSGLELPELSMGMTDDFEIAIEEGATIVRVGRAVFGERTK
jgi:pyridoxal phosphate enzyme (YggS family)